ncbi:MAG: hypothetical protein KDK38_10865 [Leptospiraceae bacterium]|nr:hypothetical protein [Leptospiraceae bacterium]
MKKAKTKKATRKPAVKKNAVRKSVKTKSRKSKPAAKKSVVQVKAVKPKRRVKRNPVAAKPREGIFIDVGTPPRPKKELHYIGELSKVQYETAAGTHFEHDFKDPRPYLVSDGTELFVIRRRKDMWFNPKRGIIN